MAIFKRIPQHVVLTILVMLALILIALAALIISDDMAPGEL